MESRDSSSYILLLHYENNNETYWKVEKVDELEYLSSYNETGSLELGKNFDDLNFF